jgi:type VI secretion system secreted protein VgrG
MADVDVFVLPKLLIDGNEYRVISYALHESLFDVGSVSCELAMLDESAPTDPIDIVGKDAELELKRTDESQSRKYFGLVVSAERVQNVDDVHTLQVSVAPKLWRTGKRADCRIFQKKSVKDIVLDVLDRAGVPHDWRATESYDPRDYVVQYRESDLDFIMRLCSEEGIWFFVEHKDEAKVVFADNVKGLGNIEGKSTLGYIEQHGFQQALDYVMHVEEIDEVRTDKVTIKDWDPEKPKAKPPLESTKEGTDDGAHALEVYTYPGRFAEKKVADRYAAILLDSIQAERNVIRGETGVLTMVPGYRFTLELHPYAPLNQEYLVIEVDCFGSEERHGAQAKGTVATACRFAAVPTKRSPYRPPRVQRERFIAGTQTAFTTGPAGEEIHTDKGMHVKAQFHWDRLGKKDENSSRWMRTLQLPTGGSMLIPRMKWEVAVRHKEGDVDRPVVMARLYNALTPPPYALPEGKAKGSIQTATTPGGGSTNEFRTDDTKGSEEMFFNASKDMSIDVLNNTTESVGNNQTRIIGSNHKLDITNSLSASVGASQTISVGGNQKVAVSTFYADEIGGDHTLSISGNRTMMIGGDHQRDVGASSTLKINGLMIDLVVGSVSESTLASHGHKVGAALVELTASDYSVMVGAARSENTGAAKIIATKGGRGVDVGGAMTQKVAGAIINKISGDKNESASASYTEIAAGAHLVKAANITFEADSMLTLVMGASTITLLPAAIMIAGTSVKLNGDAGETAAMILEN